MEITTKDFQNFKSKYRICAINIILVLYISYSIKLVDWILELLK